MEINPYQGTLHGGQPQPSEPKSWPLKSTLLGCLAVIGILGVLIVLALPMQRRAGPAAHRMQCANNLKQIAVALHLYQDEYGVFPPAYTVDAEGKPLHSWRTLILPFLEQEHVYQIIDLSKPWDDPVNKRAFDAPLAAYMCPSTTVPDTHTLYMAVAVPGGCFRPTEPRMLSEITDEHNLTLMVIEVDEKQAVHWMSPTDAVDLAFLQAKAGAALPHPGGTHAAFVSGKVSFLSARLKPETIRTLITIDGKDNVNAEPED